VSLLRDSFAGVNARFHLVGLYTLIEVLLPIVVSLAGDDPSWSGAILAVFVLSWGVEFGILGLLYHAAAGHHGRPSFARYATHLFLPLFWLRIKLALLVYGPVFLAAWAYHGVAGPADVPFDEWLLRPFFYLEPLAGLAVLVLALYSTPICILQRERGRRGAPIRQGLQLLRACPNESLKLLGLIALIIVLAGIVHLLHGPEMRDPVPDIPGGLVMLVTSYLNLVALFAATRVVLGRINVIPESPPRVGRNNGPPA
jgi:hypothetical protein